MLGQQLLVDTRPVIEPFQISFGQEDAQVPVAGLVLDQEEEMVVGRLLVPIFLVETAARGDVDLAAEDGLDPGLLGRLEELDRPEDVAVVGQGHGAHAVPGRGLAQGVDAHGPVQNAVLRMVVEMDEIRGHGVVGSMLIDR